MKRLTLILPFLILMACDTSSPQEKEQAQVEALQTEVIKIHDEVMPKTAAINRVGRKFKAILNKNIADEVATQKLVAQIAQLNKADVAMTDWMRNYKAPAKSASFESAMQYLNEEKRRIIEVRDLMNSSLEDGEKLLETLEDLE